ncbi:MAG: hypothetical protein COB01_11440 [Lutibacter sp.]|nr:MAG: hypothetical protein COB01_11440 [Lutibacter sp.]
MKQIKYSILIVVGFTINTAIFSQQEPKVNPENMVGIMMYDSDEVIKKIKVKKEPKRTNVLKSISVYNNKINEIKIFNYLTFNNVKTFISKKINEAKLTGDYRSMRDAQLKVQEMLDPIRSKIKVQDSILNENLEKELTPKEYKNWTKYRKSQIQKLKPKTPQRPKTQYLPQNQRRGYGRGTNRRRY